MFFCFVLFLQISLSLLTEAGTRLAPPTTRNRRFKPRLLGWERRALQFSCFLQKLLVVVVVVVVVVVRVPARRPRLRTVATAYYASMATNDDNLAPPPSPPASFNRSSAGSRAP